MDKVNPQEQQRTDSAPLIAWGDGKDTKWKRNAAKSLARFMITQREKRRRSPVPLFDNLERVDEKKKPISAGAATEEEH